MIRPSERTLMRRSKELRLSAEREMGSDSDTAALLLFYAAECALKSIYLNRHGLADTDASSLQAMPARSFGHDIPALVQALGIPATQVGPLPSTVMRATKEPCGHAHLHEAWRYGEKVRDLAPITTWLGTILSWAQAVA